MEGTHTLKMSDLNDFKNYTISHTTLSNDTTLRQGKTFHTPILGLLLAASVLAKSSQAKPYFLSYGQSPWYPLKALYHNLPSVSQFWRPIPGNTYPRYTHLNTSPPQIQPPPLNHEEIINIRETSPEGDLEEVNTDEISLDDTENLSKIPEEEDLQADSSYLNQFDVENSTIFFYEYNDTVTELTSTVTTDDFLSTIKRDRRTTPGGDNIRRAGTRRPINDYVDSKNRRRRRRTTTPSYDYNLSNRRRKRPSKNRNKPNNRRPINKDSEFYDNSQYDEDYYDDYYPNNIDVFAKQGEFTTTTITTTTAGTTPASTNTPSPTTVNNTYGYTYGPPVQAGYGPPGQTGYGPPGQTGYGPPQTGYGPSNGNEYVSITYPPLTDPGRDVLAPLLDSLYNQYSKNSIIRRLQELLQSNNFYNSQQYDVNYPENF